MSATRSPATPPASRTTPPPSPQHSSLQELDLPASSPLRNTGDSSPLDLSPLSSPEKPHAHDRSKLDHDSPSPPSDLANLASRTSADNIASLPAEIDSALRHLKTSQPTLSNIHNTTTNININTPPTGNGQSPIPDDSSPMELVDDDIGAALELEGSDEYLGDDYMQDLRRVKVYELIDQNWKDLGTAFCSGEFDESIREAQLIAKSEETQEILLQITVRADEVYQRQADTLIVWTEPSGKDYALSFQDVEGCTEVWEFITEVRRHLRAAPEVDPAAAFPDPAAAIQPRLPVPTLGNLAEIELQIRSVQRASPIRDRVVENVLSLDLVRKLVHLMGDAEDLQSVKDLHQICSLMQAILLLNDSNIYEHILRDDVFIDMVGLMEYDPEFPDLKAHYREFLQSNARHHQVIEFRDANIQAKVHQTYRLQYLKDVVLARVLDDPIFNVLNSLVIFNQIDIVQYIQSEEYFLRELFSLFVQHPGSAPLPPSVLSTITPTTTQPTTPSSSPFLGESTMAALSTGPQTVSTPSSVMPPLTPINPKPEPPPPLSSSAFPMMAAPLMTVADKRPAALLLLHQFCSMGKNVQLPMRLALFRTLVDRGILYPVQWALGQADIKVLNTAAEILAMVLDYDAGGVRGYILRQVEEDARREGAGGGPLAAATTNAAATTTGASGGAAAGDATASTPTPAGAASEATTVVATPPAAVGAPTSGNGSGSGNGGSHPSPPTLLAMMTSMLTSPKHELSLKSQLAESFRTLMDVPGLDSTLQGLKILQPQPRKEDQQSDRFLDYFYQRCAGELYKPMLDHVPEHSNVKSYPLELTRAQSDLYLYLCDLLSGFLLQHSYQSHFFVTTNNFAPRIASLLCAREKHLRLAALRFFRTCLRLNNTNVLNHLIKHNVFSPILELTKRESTRDNLLSSCCQEFFEHLRRENYRDVISFIMKSHEPLVRQLASSPIVGQRFQGLIQRWDLNNEPPPPPRQEPKPPQVAIKRWVPARAVDTEDEYFNAEEEGPAAASPGRQVRGQGRKRGMPNAGGAGNAGTRRPQRPANVALPRAYPIGTALVDYQEEDETPNGAALTEMPPKVQKSTRLQQQQQQQQQQQSQIQEGSTLRARGRRPDLARTSSLMHMDPNRDPTGGAGGAALTSASASTAGTPSSAATGGTSDQSVTIASSRRGSMASTSASSSSASSSEIGPVAMDEDDDLIGPPVSLSLSHKRRRDLEEEDETLERLAKRPALGKASSPERSPTRSGGAGAGAGTGSNGPSSSTTTAAGGGGGGPAGSQEAGGASTENAGPSSSSATSHESTTSTTRGSKRQLRVKLGNAAMLSSQPPDVKVGDKG